MAIKIYPASKQKHAKMWRDLRDKGYNIIGTWIDVVDLVKVKDRQMRDLWIKMAKDAREADVLIFYTRKGEIQRGAYVEMGIILGAGKPVLFVNPDGTKVTDAVEHPLVEQFDNLEDALDYVDVLEEML